MEALLPQVLQHELGDILGGKLPSQDFRRPRTREALLCAAPHTAFSSSSLSSRISARAIRLLRLEDSNEGDPAITVPRPLYFK